MSWRPVVVAVVLGLGLRSVEALAGARQADFDPRFAPTISNQFNGKPMRLILTGTAVRTKYGFRVYAIGSYVQEGVKVHTGEELVRVSAAKQLHLIFEREVDGATMARSFRDAIAMNHPEPAFGTELATLESYFEARAVRRGDQIVLKSIPGRGLSCEMMGHPPVLIENPSFAQAAWEAYLGRTNLGLSIKQGLTSRL
jgi:hypothetical protein